MGKLARSDTTHIGMITNASKYVFVNFADKCLYILNNNKILNWLRGGKNIQKRQSQFKYPLLIYNAQSNSDVDHRGIKN